MKIPHIQRIFGTTEIVFGSIGALGALVGIVVAAGFATQTGRNYVILFPLISIVLSILSIIGGYGLLKMKSWSRKFVVTIATLIIINVLFSVFLSSIATLGFLGLLLLMANVMYHATLIGNLVMIKLA